MKILILIRLFLKILLSIPIKDNPENFGIDKDILKNININKDSLEKIDIDKDKRGLRVLEKLRRSSFFMPPLTLCVFCSCSLEKGDFTPWIILIYCYGLETAIAK